MRAQSPIEVILRTFSLNSLAARLEYFGYRDGAEKEKIALQHSRRVAFLRALIHIIPTAGAFAVIYFNMANIYVAAQLSNLSALQFVAKLHELTMVASLTVIVLSYLRHQVVLGDAFHSEH